MFIAADTFLALNGVVVGDPIQFSCWLVCVAGVSNEDLDEVAEHLGLDLAAELDGMSWSERIERFEGWLRSNTRPRSTGAG